MFDSKIKEIRLTKGITQEELSNMTEISQSYISKIENKNYRMIANGTSEKLLKISKALDCCPVEIFSINCSKCQIKTTHEDRILCRKTMECKGYNMKRFTLE